MVLKSMERLTRDGVGPADRAEMALDVTGISNIPSLLSRGPRNGTPISASREFC